MKAKVSILKKYFFNQCILLSMALYGSIGLGQAAEVNVYAAASLTNSLSNLVQLYQKRHPQQKINLIFAGSSTLAKQIAAGAPADLFISADQDWMGYSIQKQRIQANQQKVLLSNQLVIVAPKNSRQKIVLKTRPTLMQQSQGYLCVGQMQSVPAGKYAQQSLQYFNWQNDLQGRVVETEDVRAALAFVERGECSMAIVYQTDAQQSKKVQTIALFPTQSHSAIQYPAALTRMGQNNASARQFMQFLQGAQAKKVFQSYGFQWLLP